MGASDFRLLVRNPGQRPRELRPRTVTEARRLALKLVARDGTAELRDEAAGSTVWIHDGGTGQELQPGG